MLRQAWTTSKNDFSDKWKYMEYGNEAKEFDQFWRRKQTDRSIKLDQMLIETNISQFKCETSVAFLA